VSVQSLFANINNGENQAIKAVTSLDIISLYEDQLQNQEAVGNQQYNRVVAVMRKNNPRLDAIMSAREDAYAAQGRTGVLGAVARGRAKGSLIVNAALIAGKAAWDSGFSIWGAAMQGAKLLFGMVAKVATYFFYMALLYISYFFFVLILMRAILGFAIYLKIACLLGLILVPPAIALSYFQPLRGLAMNLVKQVLVLIMVTSAFGTAYASVFSNANLNKVVALALSKGAAGQAADAANNSNLIGQAEEMAVTVAAILGPDKNTYDPEKVESLAYFVAVDNNRAREVFLAVSRGMMMLGIMSIVIGKLYQVISGALDGGYDPGDLLHRQALETHQSMGTGGGK
jgi:hypothetical protein